MKGSIEVTKTLTIEMTEEDAVVLRGVMNRYVKDILAHMPVGIDCVTGDRLLISRLIQLTGAVEATSRSTTVYDEVGDDEL